MPICERSTKALMNDWVRDHSVSPGQVFRKADVVRWFHERYSKIKSNTVGMHVEQMSVNNPIRKHYPGVKAGSGHDLFYKIAPDQFRLWSPQGDPPPKYREDFEGLTTSVGEPAESQDDGTIAEGAREFAFERDLRNYLVKNLGMIEPGLKLYEEEGITGVEFPVGGRYIDILAVDKDARYVVFELKVSRGYDRAVGQILRYMSWVDENMEGEATARGIIVANEITEDLKLAAKRIADIRLIEYQISFKLNAV